jgi:hypothetical protein
MACLMMLLALNHPLQPQVSDSMDPDHRPSLPNLNFNPVSASQSLAFNILRL